MISIIAAMSKGRVLAQNGVLPWAGKMKNDVQHYRNTIKDQAVLMGLGTYEEGASTKLPSKLYILTHQQPSLPEGVEVVQSIEDALEVAKKNPELIVAGGASVFEQMINYTDRLYLTYIDAIYEGDRYFPDIVEDNWTTTKEESFQADDENIHPYKFVTLTRKTSED
jgi:dihydrofolate reductase